MGACISDYFRRQIPSLQVSPFLLSLALYAEHKHDAKSYGIISWDQLSRLFLLSILYAPAHYKGGVRGRKDVDSKQVLVNNSENIPVLSTLFSAQIQNTYRSKT